MNNNEKLIAEVFKNTVKAAKDLGVIGIEQLSIDGSIVKASASKNSVIIIGVLGVIGEFFTRGLKSVRNEFNLVCTAASLRKIWIHLIKES